jgi:uroporphyrin-3 C-methyltransferase
VRSSIANERATLTAAAVPARAHALDELASLRTQASSLPLAASGQVPRGEPDSGFLARTWHALSGILRVERDSAPVPAADARIAHELLALDLAQAQSALLAFDEAGFRAAGQRADELLAARFDADAPGVRTARTRLQALLGAHGAATAPQLGGALAQLRALRASHAVQSIVPTAATSAAKP